MKDFLFHGIIKDHHIRYAYTSTKNIVKKVIHMHQCDPVSGHIIGVAMTSAVLCSVLLNDQEHYNLNWQYKGLLKTILIDVNANAVLRGFISPTQLIHSTKEEKKIFGKSCELTVIKMKHGQIINSGIIQSILNDPVSDLQYFFSKSDQIPTYMLSNLKFQSNIKDPVKSSNGLMLQAMPKCTPANFKKITENLDHKQINNTESSEKRIKSMLQKALSTNSKISIYQDSTPKFQCSCNHKKIINTIKLLSYAERMDIVKKKEDLNISCHFCNKNYKLTIKECINVWQKKNNSK